MKLLRTIFSSNIFQQTNKKDGRTGGTRARLICMTILIWASGTIIAQPPQMEIRMQNLRYETSYTIAGWTGAAIVFNLEMKAGTGYIQTQWPYIAADIMIEYELGPGVTINTSASRTAMPIPNLAGVGPLSCTDYPFTWYIANGIRILISRTYDPSNINKNNFAGTWINVGTFAIPVIGGIPDENTLFRILPYNGTQLNSFWGTGEAPGLALPFATVCPAENRVGVDPHPVFNFDTLRLCYGDTGTGTELPITSINGITGTWEKGGVPVTVIETSPVFAAGALSDTTDYVFIPDNPLYCSFTSSIIVLPPTGITVDDIDDVCTGIVDLRQAITPGATDIADYRFYECIICDGTDYSPVSPDAHLPTTTSRQFYARYEPADTCFSDYVPFNVTLIKAPDTAIVTTTCVAGVISEIEVTFPFLVGDHVYSLDGITYQESPLFSGLSGTAFAIYVMDTVTLCVTVDSVFCPPCPDFPEINLVTTGGSTICIGSGTYTVTGNFIFADSLTVTHNGLGSFTTAGRFYNPPSPNFTLRYLPAAGDAGNTVTLTFTIAQTTTCPEVTRSVAFTVNGLPSAVTIDSTFQQFCDGAIIDDLDANGLSVLWYTQPTGGTLLPGNWPLKKDSVYYAAQISSAGCESSVRSGVQVGIVDPSELPSPNVADQLMCPDAAIVEYIITDGSSGIAIYTTPTGGSPMAGSDPLGDGVTYYAGYSFGAGACESEARTPFLVTYDPGQAVDPVIIDPQAFCEGATIDNIAVPSTGIVWFAPGSFGGGAPLAPGTVLLSGTNTYYARQTKGGSCAPSDPVAVEITVGGIIPPPVIHGPDYFCNGATLGNINVSGFGVVWHDDPVLDSPLPLTFEMPVGINHYYAEQSSGGGCVSSSRSMIEVTIANCGDLFDCDTIVDQTAMEDAYLAGIYTHTGMTWDVAVGSLDSVRYFIEGTLPSGPVGTLDNAIFPVGVSTVIVVGYSGTSTDSCEFIVTVGLACPPTVTGYEGHVYTVTALAGTCWTSNLRATIYEDGTTPVAWARLYESSLYNDLVHHDTVFGRLYTWYSAVNQPEPAKGRAPGVQGICPPGWHVPSIAEWSLLTPYDAHDLKSADPSHWLTPGADIYGFDSRPAGRFDSATNMFVDLYGYTAYWASDDTTSGTTYAFMINYYCGTPSIVELTSTDGLSVRCVID